jgi:hypothetical protein
MTKKIFSLIIISGTIFLSSCAKKAAVEQMTYTPTLNANAPAKSVLLNNINVGQVTGGKKTSALWIPQIDNASLKTALEQSLQAAGLSAKPKVGEIHELPPAKYVLNAVLLKLNVPINDIEMQVTCVIHYQLTAIADNKIIYDKIITSSFAPDLDLSEPVVHREQRGVGGAAQANIEQLINDLYGFAF